MNVLYINSDLEPKHLPNYIEKRENNITILSNNGQHFGIKILVGDADIYSVKMDSKNEPIIDKSKSFNNDTNNSYTIYNITEELLICLTDLHGNKVNHQIHFNVYEQPLHYDDFLYNEHLPNYDELRECILFTDEFDKVNLVARMLLDSNKLMINKGSIKGIKKFLNFVGFEDETFNVNREYITPLKTKTFTPNKLTDKPTGYYSVWVNNYTQLNDEKYTSKNLPNVINLIQDESIETFLDKLHKSFSIAMKYFTLAEQDISFIGFETLTTSERFLSIAGNATMFLDYDVHVFRRDVHINMKCYNNSQLFDYVIQENIGTNPTLYKSEVKYLDVSQNNVEDSELFLIDDEVYDDEQDKLTFDHKRIFGVAYHIDIDSPNTYIQVEIIGISNRFLYMNIDKQFVGDSGLKVKYICTQSGEFQVKITIWDLHNNREVYLYDYNVHNRIINARFDVFTSHELNGENGIIMDISSSSNISTITENYTLKLDSVPNNLSDYYNIASSISDTSVITRYSTNNRAYKLKPINSNIGLNNLTDLPIKYIDNFLNIITFPIDTKLYTDILIRPKSLDKKLSSNGGYHSLIEVYNHPNNYEYDNLFVSVMDIWEDETMTKSSEYMFISTTESGIEIYKDLYDIALLTNKGKIVSIYDMKDLRKKNIPINYDFDLFHTKQHNLNHPKVYDKMISKIESLYPKLLNIKMQSNNKSKSLKFGDVIVASIDTDTIVGEINMNWKLYNSFTGELVYNTNEYALKYRINETALYTIVLEMEIDSIVTVDRYTISADNVVSSFGINI